ncbi:MAG: TonB-dependent receptor [Sphingorhabdus sp.]
MSAAALAGLWAAPAFAQTDPAKPAAEVAADDGQLAEIVVTARKRAESVQDVPVAITAYSSQQLQERQIVNVFDLGTTTPSLTIYQSGNGPQTGQVSIRGLSQLDTLITLDAPVGLYIDGVYRARQTGSLAALVDVERVEVLKGPQGTLFGRNTTGGAISITTKAPEYSTSLSGAVRYGTNNQFDVEGVVNLPIIADKMAFRGVIATSDNDGFGRNLLSGTRQDKVKSRYYRAALRFDPADDVTLTLSGDYAKLDAASAAPKLVSVNPLSGLATDQGLQATLAEIALSQGLFTPTFDPDLVAAYRLFSSFQAGSIRQNSSNYVTPGGFGGDRSDSELWGIAASLEMDLGPAIVRSISAYRSVAGTNGFDLDGTPFTILKADTSTTSNQFSQELQLLGKAFDNRLDWIVGAFYFRETGTDQSSNSALETVALFDPRVTNPGQTVGDVLNESWALFAQGSYKLTDRLSITGGLRYSSDLRAVKLVQLQAGVCAVPSSLIASGAVCQTDQSDRFNDWSWTFGLDYKFSDDVLVYAKTNRGYKSGGQNLRARATIAAFSPFKPETVTDIEVGLKSEFWDRRARVNVAAFNSWYRDIQRTTLVPVIVDDTVTGTSTVITNAAKGYLRGFEVEVTVLPVKGFRVSGNLAYVKSGYDSFPDAIFGDRKSEPFPYAPRWTYSLSAGYDHEVSGFGVFSASADWAWTDRVNFDRGGPGDFEPSYGLLNARLALRDIDDRWSVSLFGKNLTDKDYFSGRLGLGSNLGYVIGYAGRPRTFGIELRGQFSQ